MRPPDFSTGRHRSCGGCLPSLWRWRWWRPGERGGGYSCVWGGRCNQAHSLALLWLWMTGGLRGKSAAYAQSFIPWAGVRWAKEAVAFHRTTHQYLSIRINTAADRCCSAFSRDGTNKYITDISDQLYRNGQFRKHRRENNCEYRMSEMTLSGSKNSNLARNILPHDKEDNRSKQIKWERTFVVSEWRNAGLYCSGACSSESCG